MIVALYSRLPGEKTFRFVIAQVMPPSYSYPGFKEYLCRNYGSAWGIENKCLPANSVSDLPNVLENIDD